MDIENTFTYHAPFGDQAERYAEIRKAAKDLALTMERACPGSRELLLALTAVQQAAMWANASIAINEKAPGTVPNDKNASPDDTPHHDPDAALYWVMLQIGQGKKVRRAAWRDAGLYIIGEPDGKGGTFMFLVGSDSRTPWNFSDARKYDDWEVVP